MSRPASYYVSASPGETRDGSYGSPYGLSDLNWFGGSVKTINAGEVVAVLDGSYTVPANMETSTFGSWAPTDLTIFRGCKADGSWDETGLTRPTLNAGNYDLLTRGDRIVFADLKLVSGSPSQNALLSRASHSTGWRLWNVGFEKGPGTCSAGLAWNSQLWMAFCDFVGFPTGASISFASVLVYCSFVDCNGVGLSVTVVSTTANTAVSHCVANRCGVGFRVPPRGSILLHNTAAYCTSDGFQFTSGTDEPVALIGNLSAYNGGYGYAVSGSVSSAPVRVAYGNSAYGNTSGPASGWTAENFQMYDTLETTVDPDFVSTADLTPRGALRTLSDRWHGSGAGAGRNVAGALTRAYDWGGGGPPGVSSRRPTFAAMLG